MYLYGMSCKPRLVIDADIMKEIRGDLEGGFGFGQGHVGMSCVLLRHGGVGKGRWLQALVTYVDKSYA